MFQEKLSLVNVRNNSMCQPLMYIALRLQKTKGSLQAGFTHQTIECVVYSPIFMFIVEELFKELAEKPLQRFFLSC